MVAEQARPTERRGRGHLEQVRGCQLREGTSLFYRILQGGGGEEASLAVHAWGHPLLLSRSSVLSIKKSAYPPLTGYSARLRDEVVVHAVLVGQEHSALVVVAQQD